MANIKFSATMAEFRKKINFVRNGLGASKTDLPVTLMRFEIAGNKATIFAASKEMFCRTEMKIVRPDDDQGGAFTVLGLKIERLISQVEAEQISFSADGENVEIQVGFLTVNFELYDGAVLRTVEQGVQAHLQMDGLLIDRAALEEALNCARTCTTTNSIRPDVTHVELRKGRMLSSDGRKIMIYTHDGFPKDANLKCPAATIGGLTTAVKNIEAEKVQLIEGDAYYFLKANLNEYSLGIRKVERSFIAVEEQILAIGSPVDEVSMDKHVLEAILKGVALGLPTDEVKVTFEVGGTGKESYVEVAASNSLGRRSYERCSGAGRKGTDKITFPLSFKHVLDTLSVFKGDSVVDMMIHQKVNLLMVRDTTEVREVLTVIPFRTDAAVDMERKEAEAAAEARKKAQKEDGGEAAEGSETAAAAVAPELED